VAEQQPDGEQKPALTAADLAEANARAGLARGIRTPLAVRSEVERGPIGWVDAFLESDAAFTTKLDPRMLRPAEAQPVPNRATRRGKRGRRRQ
jgi:hypothetical protein